MDTRTDPLTVNADPRLRVRIVSDALPWVPCEVPGAVWKVLEHNGRMPGRYTALMRWPERQPLDYHVHEAGEEVLVLDGAFDDEYGEYGAGVYLRNPPGSSHRPTTHAGCLMLVKSRQMNKDDDHRVVVDTRRAAWMTGVGEGLSVLPLHQRGLESVSLMRMARGCRQIPHRHLGGEEIYVISGAFRDEFGQHGAGTWLRYPAMSSHEPQSEHGCLLYVKSGHLAAPARAA